MSYPTLPATLSQGIVSIYGLGDTIGYVSGITTIPGFYFGPINQVSIYSSYNVGDSVMFPESAIHTRIDYGNNPYTLIDENKIILIELSL